MIIMNNCYQNEYVTYNRFLMQKMKTIILYIVDYVKSLHSMYHPY